MICLGALAAEPSPMSRRPVNNDGVPRRSTRRAAARLVAVLCCTVGSAACADNSPRESGTAFPSPRGVDLTEWPEVDSDGVCELKYPRDLVKLPFAIDGQIESITPQPFDAVAQARPVHVGVRIREVFRGDFDQYVVLRTWDFALPEQDLRDDRVLAATDHMLEMKSCGFTRPYSPHDGRLWRERFADLPPEDCGQEVRQCDLDDTSPVAAVCSRASYEYAIHFTIDAGSYPFKVIGCNDEYLSLRLDLGADSCLPEASEEQRQRCARKKTAYFVAGESGWSLLTYEERTNCDYVQQLEPSFPTGFCTR